MIIVKIFNQIIKHITKFFLNSYKINKIKFLF